MPASTIDKSLITQTKAEINKLLKSAITHHDAHEKMVNAVEEGKKSAIEEAWECGKALNKLKGLIGHGNWQTWLEVNFCRPRQVSYQTAVVYMRIDSDNPNVQRVADLEFDTIRRYAHRFVPDKERPNNDKENVKFPRLVHHLAVVNEWNKWKRRVDTKQIEAPSKKELRRDFAEIRQWLDSDVYDDD